VASSRARLGVPVCTICTSDLATSASSASSTIHSSMASSPHTACAPCSAKLSANTARRRNTVFCVASSRPWLHRIAARSVCWRSGASALPRVSSFNW
jgi:hypothetical protein